MKEFKLGQVFKNESRGTVTFYATWDGKKKKWQCSKGLFELIEHLSARTEPKL